MTEVTARNRASGRTSPWLPFPRAEVAYVWIRLPLPVVGRFVARRKSIGVRVMVEKQTEPDGARATEDEGHNAHPVEPAEGARQPGEDTDESRPPHPDEPAEGER